MSKFLSKGSARWFVLALVVSVGVMALAGAKYLRASDTQALTDVPTFTVAKGPLTISVTESGTIKPRQQEIIKSEVEGSSTILFLIPDGTRVKAGDLLVELDASKMQDQKVSQQITVQNAEAAYIGARETLEVTKSQSLSDVSVAELTLRFAKEDWDKYNKGDYPKELNDAQAKIKVAEEELTRAREKYNWSLKLFKETYLSETEKQADELAVLQKELSLKLAKGDLELLQKWTSTRKLAELESAIEQAEMALDRTKRKAAADLVQAEASLKAKELEYERQRDLLDKSIRMIEKAKIVAPIDGLAVYATTGGGGDRFRGSQEPLAEGSTVRERQELIYLPTATQMNAEVKIHESSLDKVRLGLPVRVTIDAMPDRQFTGRVTRVAPLPDATSFWQNPDMKVFNTEIQIDGDGSELRTGMSCRAEIVVERYPEAIYVPVQSVVRVRTKPTVWVMGTGGAEPREVELGMDNNRMVRIVSGLEAGERVLLSPPLAEAAAGSEEKSIAFPDAPAPTTRPAGAMPAGEGRSGMPGTTGERRTGEGRRGGGEGREGRGTGEGREGRGAGGEGRDRTGGGMSGAGAPGGAGGGMRGGFGDMTPEQRTEAMRRRMESMTPEQREEMQKRIEQFQRQGGGAPGGPGGAGRGPGGGN